MTPQQQQVYYAILATAFGEIGQTETIGSQHNPRIIEYFKAVGHSWVQDDETAWCAAAVGWVLETNGYKSTRKLNAKSYLAYGIEATEPMPGDLAIFTRGNPSSPFGHVAFYLGQLNGLVHVLGGNQNNQWNVTAYDQRRLISTRRFIY